MNDNFNDQKEKLVSLSHEINLLRQQVNYLLRNEKPLGLLDLDVLMNRTHTIYDMLCTINLGESADNEELELDPEAIAGLFGVDLHEEEKSKPDEIAGNQDNEEVESESVEAMLDETPKEKPEELKETLVEPVEETEVESIEKPIVEVTAFVEESAQTDLNEELPAETNSQMFGLQESETTTPESVEPVTSEPQTLDEPMEEAKPNGDEYGFLFRFEEVSPADDFETEKTETLGDRMMKEDHSLAAKLQQNPIRDLRSVIGINDKFLFVNELFGGSMEKYNKSIDNLNDLKTMNGALIYLNELKIELQWNSSNEAYRKLSELVRRKFE